MDWHMLKLLKSETDVEPTDHVVIYPTVGHLTRDGAAWRIDVYGTVYTAAGSVNPAQAATIALAAARCESPADRLAT